MKEQIVWVVFKDRADSYGGDKLIAICSTEEKAIEIAKLNDRYYWDDVELDKVV